MTTPKKNGDREASGQTNSIVKRLNLCDLHSVPRDIILGYVSNSELLEIASIDTARLNRWIRGYFSRFKVLNLKPYVNKMCLSSEPCSITDPKCQNGRYPHRIVRTVFTMRKLVELNLLNVNTICIEAPVRPKQARCTTHGIKAVCELFNTGIQRVFIHVNNEEPYVEIVKRLLIENDVTLREFNVRHSNPGNSMFNFDQFSTHTIWFDQDFPMLIGFKKRKLKNKNNKQKMKRLKVLEEQALLNFAGLEVNLEVP